MAPPLPERENELPDAVGAAVVSLLSRMERLERRTTGHPGRGPHAPEHGVWRGEDFSEIDADLTGVEVSVLYLLRPTSHVQGPRHLSFWESYFASQGAAIADWRSIPGD